MSAFWKSRQALRFKLAVYVALVLGAALSALFMWLSMKAEIHRKVVDAKTADARYIAATLDREIALRLRALDSLSAPVAGLILAGREPNGYLADQVIVQSLFSRDVYVISAAGERIAESPSRGNLGISYRDAAYFQQAMASGQPVVKPLVGRFAKAPVLVFALPLKGSDGRLLGLLCGSERIGAGTPFDFSAMAKPGSSQSYHLVSRPDALQIASTDSQLLLQALEPRGLFALLDRHREGWTEATRSLDSQGLEVISVAADLASVDWYVVAQISGGEVFLNPFVVEVACAMGLVALALWLVLQREMLPMGRAARQLQASLEAARTERTDALEGRRRAEEATLAKSNFLAHMSHEIRTPMNGILGLAYLLEKNPLSADSRELVQKIRATGANLLAVINDILDYSKIEAGHLHVGSTAFSLDELLDHLATLMGAFAEGKNLVLAIAPPERPLCALVGDRMRLLQVLVNLASNAIKFTPSGFVEVGVDIVSQDSEHLLLEFRVRDSGIGVPLHMQQHIFSPFEQADNSTTREFGGTGLGLSISRRLVELMGGSLQMRSAVGQGSSFFFSLAFGKTVPAAEAVLAPLRVLIAHKSDIARAALCRTVRSLGGLAQALEPSEVLDLRLHSAVAQGEPFDVLLLDGRSSRPQALQMLDLLLAPPALAPWPVVLLLTDLAGQSLDLSLPHIDAALSLPLSALALGTAIHSALQLRAGVAPPALQAAARLAGLRLLLVDDSEVNLEVAMRILAGEGAHVDCASDGTQALHWLQHCGGAVDVVLMDVQMPAMDGYQTTRKIRALPALAQLPVVALTAGVSDARREEALAAGMSDFVCKPFDVEEIVALIRKLTPHHAPAQPAPLLDLQAARALDLARVTMDMDRALVLWKDASVYRKFLHKFVRDYQHCVSEMRNMDPVAAKAHAHKLRGAAGSLVLDGLVQACRALEQCLTCGVPSQDAYALLQQALDGTVAQIHVYAGVEPQCADAASPATIDRNLLRPLLLLALQRLEEDSPAAVEPVLADLATLLPAAELLALRGALESYAFDACKLAVRFLARQHHIQLET